MWPEARKARGRSVLREITEMGRSQILKSLVSHVKNVSNQSRLEENSTDLPQMLWDIGNRCQERSREIASVCEGPAEVGHHDNVMKAISTAI